MQRALHLLDQIGDVVQVESGPSASEFTSLDDKSLARFRPRCICQTSTKCVVDHIAEGASGPPGQGLQLGRHIVIKRQGRSHIMMLNMEHHDVKRHQQSAFSNQQSPRCSSHDPSLWIQNHEF